MERYDITSPDVLFLSRDGDLVRYEAAQQALDAEREKVKALEERYEKPDHLADDAHKANIQQMTKAEILDWTYIYMRKIDKLQSHLAQRDGEVRALKAELNTPEVLDFAKAVNLEAAHQRERWGSEHDSGKTDADWFWLIGYLTGKALHKPEKRLHHLIAAAAALANWHLAELGKTNMRPGIEEPKDAALTPDAGEALPTTEEMGGSDPEFTGGMTTKEYLDDLRN